MKRPATKPKATRATARGPTPRKLAAARRHLSALLQHAQFFGAEGSTKNDLIIERLNAALDALR